MICPAAEEMLEDQLSILPATPFRPSLKQRPKRPTGTVAREHIKIVYVNIGLSMRTSHFRREMYRLTVGWQLLPATFSMRPPSE